MDKLRPICAFLVLGSSAAFGDTLDVAASIASATVRANCAAEGKPASLTITGADSVREYGPDALADTNSLEVEFQLPARQVPPLPARGFCTAEPVDGKPREDARWKPAFVSLHVGLRCADENGERLTTRNAVVDLRLQCDRETAADQESSE